MFSSVQSLSCVRLIVTPWITARQASLSITKSRWGNSGSSVRLYFLGSKITAVGDCSHEIKRHLLLGRNIMTNLDSILKSRDITLPTKVLLVKAMVFPVVMYGCESWTVKKAEHWRIDAFELLDIWLASIFSHALWPSKSPLFHFIDCFLCRKKLFSLMQSHFPIFNFVFCAFHVISKKSLLKMLWKFPLVFF